MKKKSYDFRFLILSFCFFNILIFQQTINYKTYFFLNLIFENGEPEK